MSLPSPGSTRLAVDALAPLEELLLTLADDEFVIGFWDSEWTGIGPMLEEDVAMSSLAQDEIGHARLLYEELARLTAADPDEIAFGRSVEEFRHAHLLDHPRIDWAFTIARRYLYETADAVRLEALVGSSHGRLADAVAKIRREERYHLMHVDAWLRRLALGDGEGRARLESAFHRAWRDASSLFAPLAGEEELVGEGVIARSTVQLHAGWLEAVQPVFEELALPFTPSSSPPADGRRGRRGEAFRWLWGEFTSVARLERDARW